MLPSDWIARETARIADAPALPWAAEAWWTERCDGRELHFVHVSKDDPSKLAYTPDERHGREDRQLRTRPGRYLTKYFADVLTAKEIAAWAGKWAGANELVSFALARTADEIGTVYANGPDSCMGGNNFSHAAESPARAYGAGDLAVAYLGPIDDAKARALVWEENESGDAIYSTIYGDADRLKPALERAGFSPDTGGGFRGARLLAEDSPHGDGFLVPYMDGDYGAEDLSRNGRRGLRVVRDGGDVSLSETGGASEQGTWCARCEESSSGETYSVDDESWCEHCYENYSFHCERCENTQSGDDYYNVSDQTWCGECCNEYASLCEKCNETREADETRCVNDNETWCDDCVSAYDAEDCHACGDSYSPENRNDVTPADGPTRERGTETWCDGCAETAFACDGCGELAADDAATPAACAASVDDTPRAEVCRVCFADNASRALPARIADPVPDYARPDAVAPAFARGHAAASWYGPALGTVRTTRRRVHPSSAGAPRYRYHGGPVAGGSERRGVDFIVRHPWHGARAYSGERFAAVRVVRALVGATDYYILKYRTPHETHYNRTAADAPQTHAVFGGHMTPAEGVHAPAHGPADVGFSEASIDRIGFQSEAARVRDAALAADDARELRAAIDARYARAVADAGAMRAVRDFDSAAASAAETAGNLTVAFAMMADAITMEARSYAA